MSNVKERIIGALTVMSDEEAILIWNMIAEKYNSFSWENIEETEPDEWDLKMMNDIDGSEPDEYISSEELKKKLGLNF